jgi:hypothetical protein
MERGNAMKLIGATTGLLFLLGGGGGIAAPQVEYSVSVVDETAGMRSQRYVWELRDSLNRFFKYRITANDQSGFRYKDDEWMVHNLTTDSRGIAFLLDWHPLAGGFRVSSGLVAHRQTLDYVVAPTIDEIFQYDIQYDLRDDANNLAEKAVEFGFTMEDVQGYLPDDIFSSRKITINKHIKINPDDIAAHARVKYELPAPYVGMGWSSRFFNNSRLRYSFDIGVLYQIAPEIDMLVQGNMVDVAEPAVVSWLSEWTFEQKQELSARLDNRKLSPRLGFGLSYRLY